MCKDIRQKRGKIAIKRQIGTMARNDDSGCLFVTVGIPCGIIVIWFVYKEHEYDRHGPVMLTVGIIASIAIIYILNRLMK